MTAVAELAEAVIAGDEERTPVLSSALLAAGLGPQQVLNDGLLAGMTEVGRRFSAGEFFLPEVLVAAGAMQAGMAVLKPHLAEAGVKPAATAAIGTVRGDLHDIGKNLVAIMLEGAGFEVVDLGVDVTPEQFVAVCRARLIHVVGLSALLTTTMPAMADIIRRLREEVHPTPAVIIGGAPITQAYADQIGASGYGHDAPSGATLAKRLCGF
jgi:5-methyltetrahydrofolate--homocysteine methyltransferase